MRASAKPLQLAYLSSNWKPPNPKARTPMTTTTTTHATPLSLSLNQPERCNCRTEPIQQVGEIHPISEQCLRDLDEAEGECAGGFFDVPAHAVRRRSA